MGTRDESEQVLRIARLPLEYKERGNVSWVDLVREVLPDPSAVPFEPLVACLRAHPELADVWLQWSEDRRSGPSWFFRRIGEPASPIHEVGYWGRPFRTRQRDATTACAMFIQKEIESVTAPRPSGHEGDHGDDTTTERP